MLLKEYVKKLNIPMICLVLVTGRVVLTGASIGDSISIIALAGLFGFLTYTNQKTGSWMATIESEIIKIKNELQSARLNNSIIRKSNEAKKQDEGKRWY